MKAMRKILSVILTLAMLLSLTPMVFAEGSAAEPRVPLTDPSAERIFCVVNDLMGDEFGYITTKPEYVPVPLIEDGANLKLSLILNEDGTFTELAITAIDEALKQAIENGEITEEDLEGIEIPGDIYGAFELVTELIYEIILGVLSGLVEYDESVAAAMDELTAKYPDGKALHAEIIDTYFGGNAAPSVEELLTFVAGDMIIIDDEGYILYKYSDFLVGDDGETMFLETLIAPTGAYLKSYEMFGNNRNVYAQLKAAYDAGEISAEDAFTILTGYSADTDGDLSTVFPIYDYVYNAESKRTKSLLDMVNEDGTVLDTGLSVLDYVVERAVADYNSISSDSDFGEYEDSAYLMIFVSLLEDCMPDLDEMPGMDMTEEELRDMIVSEISAYADSLREEGYADDYIQNDLLWMFGGFEWDHFGYIIEGKTYGSICDDAGNKLNISDIMDDEGKFLTDEYGAETVWELFEAYLAGMSTEATLKGDVNDDGKITLNDASAMLKKIAKWDIEVSDDAADTDGDGKVTLFDVSLTLKHIAGWDVEFEY